MFRMILADDEPVITRGIQQLVDWNALGIKIIGVYEDGKSAFEAIVMQKPDLALLDISMPDMTGLEIIRECSEMELKTKIIFISGYQDFEFAQSAIQYGAQGYLLKPVVRDQLLKVVEKGIRGNGGEEKQKEQQPAANYSGLVNVENTVYTPAYVLPCYPPDISDAMKKLMDFSMAGILEEFCQTKGLGITFVKQEMHALILKEVGINEAVAALEELAIRIQQIISIKVIILVADQITSMSQILGALKECRQYEDYAFFVDQLSSPVILISNALFSKSPSNHSASVRAELMGLLCSMKESDWASIYGQYCKSVCAASEGKKEYATFYLASFMQEVQQKMESIQAGFPVRSMQELLAIGDGCHSFTELAKRYKDVFAEMQKKLQMGVAENSSNPIDVAKTYIQKHYRENVSLQVLADVVHMNAYYFSSYFKKNVGENFKDYVNKIRLEHALKLLGTTDMKMYEIAEHCGFPDVRTYNELFLKTYGQTPKEYKKNAK